ncbi:transketolase [Rhodopseudomonas thermotolerans]|uniref:Transketolase n=2 Tax=Rhodopseudomonas TaxID=1073 RepID=A0A336JJY6_9BRAD|nr:MULTISPECIES: transketolase C-terminal domain-containing protein [Rhodopseudomonas]RED37992.1 transketolase [Rhodopseudomonas pentothenatexigens]REG05185.1 transketolase [Rhodopseudomonas thermotolerans]SSW90017.1 transketolase [Rhodopseudomonas pentothenatexigens]
MGDLIGDVVESELYYVPAREFDRVRQLNAPRPKLVSLYADMARLNALYMIARAGSGHIGSSFSSLDILSHLYLTEMNRDAGDIFFSSKGHDAPALYAVLIAQGVLPEQKLHGLRRLGGLPGHPDIGTPGLVTNTGSLGMGISKAKGMLFANRVTGKGGRVFVLTGDGELQEGQIWESLVSAANHRVGNLTVIVDHNKFQSDFSVERTSSLGDLDAKFRAFGWHVARIDGHDTELLAETFKALEKITDQPKVVIADTVKGKGVSFMEGTSIDSDVEMFRFHSGAPKADEYLRAVEEIEARISSQLAGLHATAVEVVRVDKPVVAPAPAGQVKLFPAYTEALLVEAEKRPELVALDADLALDMGLLPFGEKFPDRYLECGIAEQDMVSQAGGMALRGLLPVVHSFSCFLSTRPNEQIYNNATEDSRIVYVGGLSGVLPAGPGHSHQSVREISALGGIPNLVMVEPCCPEEVAPLLRWCLDYQGPSFLRMISIPYVTSAKLPADYVPQSGRGVTLRSGGDATIVTSGLLMTAEALRAAELLAQRGIAAGVVAHPWLNRADPEFVLDLAARAPVLITLDNHFRIGGQGQHLIAALAGSNPPRMPRCLSLGLEQCPPSGRNDEVLDVVGLDADRIAQRIAEFLGSGTRKL